MRNLASKHFNFSRASNASSEDTQFFELWMSIENISNLTLFPSESWHRKIRFT